MKVVTGETMQQMDRRTIEEFGVPGLVLMENAGLRCAEAINAAYGSVLPRKAAIFAGKGNNGGDGYVIARLLQEQGWEARVFVMARGDEITGDAAINLQRLDSAMVTFCPEPGALDRYKHYLADASLVVDALLGTGLKSDVRGLYAEAIDFVNNSGKTVFAVDIPSGIGSGSGKVRGKAVQADLTVTFALAKLGNVLYPGAELCGSLKVVDIGMPAEVISEADGYEFVDMETARLLLKKRKRQAHKGDCGHCLIVAGSTGKTGAAAMAANSAVRAGAGLVTLAVPATLHAIMEIKTTEAMTLPLADVEGFIGEAAYEAVMAEACGKDAVAIGPGISSNPSTAAMVRKLVTALPFPLILDADGLNAISEDRELLLRKKSATVILTPHPGEMARLAGITVADVEMDRITVASGFSTRYNVYLVLKGARTIIAAPDGDIAINGSGNPGMASGGMGDVLTGIITALIAQGYAPFAACKLGAFLHGYAADLVAAEKGEVGMSAVDVQERLPYACKQLSS
jgi:ADP-dependent NAD(P)H-hydrate dehydratase / NAD(P)H-hydrate epimerase